MERDEEQNALAKIALVDSDALEALKRSLSPLVHHHVEHKLAPIKFETQHDKALCQTKLTDRCWEELEDALGLFNSNQDYQIGTIFSFMIKKKLAASDERFENK